MSGAEASTASSQQTQEVHKEEEPASKWGGQTSEGKSEQGQEEEKKSDGAAAPPSLPTEDDTEEKDPTRALLRAWARRNQRVRLVLPRPPASWTRERRLALCRHALLAEARASLPAASGVLVALDLDCALPAALPAAVADLRGASGYEVATANSPGHYRDKWALRAPKLGLDYDCWHDPSLVGSRGSCFEHAFTLEAAAPDVALP